MARHIVAVCVVCLLCADRLPCQQHVEDDIFAKQADRRISPSTIEYNNNHHQQQQQNNIDLQSNAIAYPNKRRKRHAGHATSPQLQPQYTEITEKFLQRIFDEYGQADGTIHYKDFQRMLRQLGLQQLLEQKLTKANETCISDATLVQHVKPHAEHEHHEHHGHGSDCMQQQQHEQHEHASEESRKDCNDELCKQQAAAQHKAPTNYTLGKQDMLSLCPVLLYQLTAATDSERNGCIENSLLSDIDCHDDIRLDHIHDDKVHVWFYAFISVLACSILGLVGVAIIPFMDSRFYKHIIQFFVALAVGTMTGDALLHLLPHSLAGQSETNMIFKGLTCMGGIIFFYITEHGLTMISEWRRRIEKQEQTKPARAKVMHDPDSSIHTQAQSGDKLCKSKYSSYPYCYDEIAMAIKKEDRQQHNNCSNNEFPARNCSKRNSRVEPDSNEPASQSLLSTSHNHYAPIAETGHHHAHNHNHHCSATTSQMVAAAPTDSNNIATDIDGNAIGDGASISRYANGGAGDSKDIKPSSASTNDAKDEPVTVILREHESQHHGHSHKHGHVHSPPTSLSSVAWMIIMGDGLHNFTDGMAIGAAFAENIAGGFSTSLAVFCHELPHELGDFAILIKAGMSIRSAVYYNLLTGVLSFIGMIFGLVFGQTPEAAQWMFAAAAGLFIYIALVDMMPELSAPHKSLRQLVLQILGMSSGVLIMLLIAIYEGDLMSVFANTSLASSKPGY